MGWNWWETVDWQDPINRDCPLNAGIVGWWMGAPGLFGGNRLWDLCNKNHGTLTNMDPVSDWVNSQYGPVLDFDASNDLVVIDRPALVIGSPLMVFSTARPALARGDIYSEGWSGGNPPIMRLCVNESGGTEDNVCFNVRDNVSVELKATSADVNITDGEWHSICGGYNGSNTATVYKDGQLVGTDTGTSPGTTTLNRSAIGCLRRAANALFFSGRVGMVMIRSMTPSTEAAALFHDQWRRGFPDMLNHYRRRTIFLPPADAGNRRRRLLICGAA